MKGNGIGSQCLRADHCYKAMRNWNTWKSLLIRYENLYPLYCTVKGINKPYLTLPTLPRGLCH